MTTSDKLDPDQFIISRKRKKYRFALFANAPNCFELEQWQARKDSPCADLTVEVGAGTALFLVELARRHPNKDYIALDVKADRLQKGARTALDLGLTNISFVRARADQLLEVVAEQSVSEIWLTFSDPFPKKSDAKRRLAAPSFLKIYKNALVLENAHLKMKTDSHDLFDWSLEQLVTTGWSVVELSYDLHDSDLADDYKILTTYEQKWQTEGLRTYFLSACCRK